MKHEDLTGFLKPVGSINCLKVFKQLMYQIILI